MIPAFCSCPPLLFNCTSPPHLLHLPVYNPFSTRHYHSVLLYNHSSKPLQFQRQPFIIYQLLSHPPFSTDQHRRHSGLSTIVRSHQTLQGTGQCMIVWSRHHHNHAPPLIILPSYLPNSFLPSGSQASTSSNLPLCFTPWPTVPGSKNDVQIFPMTRRSLSSALKPFGRASRCPERPALDLVPRSWMPYIGTCTVLNRPRLTSARVYYGQLPRNTMGQN